MEISHLREKILNLLGLPVCLDDKLNLGKIVKRLLSLYVIICTYERAGVGEERELLPIKGTQLFLQNL